MDKSTLIYNTLEGLSSAEPQQLAQIRQDLYNQLGLTFEQQTALYTSVLGPAGAGKLTDLDNAVLSACKIVGE
ncbi:PAS factor family protein [Vibrio sp. D404a]|uniref:PAS factor family protein n=1 Tax=unclassified Vibrio TaxID=2614977 RepID=UPI002554AE72|nr:MULTISPECIES: PAS factor family protein [unclassified Vibrio]MDK9738200.1 PAS factor family protein [Vibrio sp. D404a]MDK9796491.1 PAS factor family protein [Vibrio sp. D449a]